MPASDWDRTWQLDAFVDRYVIASLRLLVELLTRVRVVLLFLGERNLGDD